jgi:uncharacterized membrane protein
MKKSNSLSNVKNLTLLATMTVLVVVFQLIGNFVPLGFNVGAFALVPIVIGAAVLGPWAGAWLGSVFGIVIIATGSASPFYTLVTPQWVGVLVTVAVVILKGALAGFVSGLLYRLIAKKSTFAAILVSSVACPVVNTAVFTVASFTVFFPGIQGWAVGAGKDIVPYVFLVLIGANFFVELGICTVLSSVSERIIKIGRKMRQDKSHYV